MTKTTTTDVTSVVQRYIPAVPAISLRRDAPGWYSDAVQQDDDGSHHLLGPICWKCKGARFLTTKKPKRFAHKQQSQRAVELNATKNSTNGETEKMSNDTNGRNITTRNCPVCRGVGRLLARKRPFHVITDTAKDPVSSHAHNIKGRITRACLPVDYQPQGPCPAALSRRDDASAADSAAAAAASASSAATRRNPWIELVQKADQEGVHVDVPNDSDGEDHQTESPTANDTSTSNNTKTLSSFRRSDKPLWIPHPGEELCRLTGRWRILQRTKGDHRWTTDDLVTAWVATQELNQIAAAGWQQQHHHQQQQQEQERQQQQEGEELLEQQPASLSCAGGNRPPIKRRVPIRYLDLGTGNGSVLQMVLWHSQKSNNHQQDNGGDDGNSAIPMIEMDATGIEARSEAVALARRSLLFNLGGDDCDTSNINMSTASARIVHADFRQLLDEEEKTDILRRSSDTNENNRNDAATTTTTTTTPTNPPPTPLSTKEGAEEKEMFDLITGTPPYFRVDFLPVAPTADATVTNTNDDNIQDGNCGVDVGSTDNTTTTTTNDNAPPRNRRIDAATSTYRAVILQGGMPTAMQSAPARCEFRGGVEAYCRAGAARLRRNYSTTTAGNDNKITMMTPRSRLVLCENHANHQRVVDAAAAAGLTILRQVPIEGRTGRGLLFSVYVMRLATAADDSKSTAVSTLSVTATDPTLTVRNAHGQWTSNYLKTVMHDMSMPTMPSQRE